MCGNHDHDGHDHDVHDVKAQPADTIELTISRAGVIQIVTGQMVTSHATVADAIAAFARAANVKLSVAGRVIKGAMRQHEHEHEHDRVKA
jgi:hypothetical protein